MFSSFGPFYWFPKFATLPTETPNAR